jgi:hypothetical protein
LVVPHLLRLCGGSDQRFLLPASALGGGALLLAADGWTPGAGGVLQKGGLPLSVDLVAVDTARVSAMARLIERDLAAAGFLVVAVAEQVLAESLTLHQLQRQRQPQPQPQLGAASSD